ncbi:dynein heavy chain, N-terminal region 2-domain-containing protein [Chytriomyces sp. MP71]|nr:dynein heavy chain, N-terminal region 2-domain-containing protein [Chytriomyces sp. MP71]
MKTVQRYLIVLKVSTINGILKLVERILEILGKIQKTLREYLEHQCSAFPRFYFLGQEDLLEIIGNARRVYQTYIELSEDE